MRKYAGKYFLLFIICVLLGAGVFVYLTKKDDTSKGRRRTLMNRVSYNLASAGEDSIDTKLEDIEYRIKDDDGIVIEDTGNDEYEYYSEKCHGTITLNQKTGKITYRPDHDFDTENLEPVEFKYIAGYYTDKEKTNFFASEPASVKITINPINDEPTIYDISKYVVGSEKETMVIPFSVYHPDNEYNEAGEKQSVTFETKILSQTAYKTSPTTPVVNTELIESIIVVYNEETEQYEIQVKPGNYLFGKAKIRLQAFDDNNPVGESKAIDIDLVFNPVNDLPEPTDDKISVYENGMITVDVLRGIIPKNADDSEQDIPDGQDVKPDSDIETEVNKLKLSIVEAPKYGTVIVLADNTIRYIPYANINSENIGDNKEFFTYYCIDGEGAKVEARVDINIVPVNSAPEIPLAPGKSDINYELELNERATKDINILKGVTDQEITVDKVSDQHLSVAYVIVNENMIYPNDAGNAESLGMTIGLWQFNNPSGLEKIGDSSYSVTAASGAAMNEETTQTLKRSELRQGYLEGSNVQGVDEMVNMINVSRCYETLSKFMKNEGDLLTTTINLSRMR